MAKASGEKAKASKAKLKNRSLQSKNVVLQIKVHGKPIQGQCMSGHNQGKPRQGLKKAKTRTDINNNFRSLGTGGFRTKAPA